ncbi:hillarin-like [Physella acuta]|uniref:hillarin-like n=1 Tax=Physella acuta TaxID=109671 RepID=UPI0027DE284B|nr:hillarin-like [Physella acuta]
MASGHAMHASRAAMDELMQDTQSSDNDSDFGHEECSALPDACHRCGSRVYPVERVDVGALFHRRCFRCRICGLQLTLRTFHWDQSTAPDIYCHAHVPRHVGCLDNEAVGIKSAMNAPKRGVTISDQTRGSVYNPGWQYDANAMEFAHYKEIYRRGRQKTTTGTYRDFEESGIFEAQTELEKVQKAEEDQLYLQIQQERKKKVKRLEEELRAEMERSVRDMVSTFERFSPQKGKTRLQKETERLEETYRRKKEEKVRKMIDRLSNEQRAKVASLIQKHSQEMLLLIAERLTASEDRVSSDSEENSPTIDLSRPPPVTPPEFKRSQLFKSPKEFEKIDNHVFQIVQKEYSTFTELVKDLIVICETDLDKARAIFRWVTWTDLNELEVEDTVCPDSPLGLLRGIKYGTETYHDLCRRLCSYAGLYCEVIEGYSKGAGYKPGMKMESDRFRNSWTAVSIDGSWCFINCNWGARHVKGSEVGPSKKKREGLRLDSNTHTHYNNVDILHEQDLSEPRGGDRRDSLETRESSGVPQLNGEPSLGGGGGTPGAGLCGAGVYGSTQSNLFAGDYRHRNGSNSSFSDNYARSKLQGLCSNSGHPQNSGFNGYSSPYAVPNGYSMNSDQNKSHSVRKLLPDGGSNKENGLDDASIASIDGFSGRSLLDAFYNKDIKSKLAVARLSDGDTASFSSGCSKSSTENMSPSQSPFASSGSTPRSGGAFSVHSDSSSSSHKDSDRYSPPQSLFRSRQPEGCGAMRPSPPQSVFRNSSGSDNSTSSIRSSPPQSLFRVAPIPYTPSKTSPPSSLLRFAGLTSGSAAGDFLKQTDRLSPPQSDSERWRNSDSSGGRSERRDSISTVGESLIGEDPGTDLSRQPLYYQCDEFYFITDPEDHIYQHYPDTPAWQLLEVPITMSEFLALPIVKSPFFNAGLKFASHYDCKQHTQKGEVTLQLKIPRLLSFGYTLAHRDKRTVSQSSLDGRVLLRIIGHKAMFTIAPPKRGRYYFTIYVKDDSGSDLLQSACAFLITCREGRETIKSPYPKVAFFGPTLAMSSYGLLPQTHIDPLVSYNHDDINFQFAASRTVRLSYSLTFHCQRADAIDADLQRYAFLRHRDDTSMALQVRCPHVGKYVFSIYGAKSANPEEPDGQYECLFRYLIDCKQSATNKSPLPRACHRWCHSQLLEPVHGDLATNSRVTFRVRAPLVCDMALLMGDAWYHFRNHPDHIWEASLTTSATPCIAKLYSRLNRETARFSPFLEFQIVGKNT